MVYLNPLYTAADIKEPIIITFKGTICRPTHRNGWKGPVNAPSTNLLYSYQDTRVLALLHKHMQNVLAFVCFFIMKQAVF